MIPLTEKGKSLAWTLALGIVLGLFAGWSLWHPRAPVVEPPAVSERQPDGALLAARRPDTVIKAVHRIPPGYVPERTIAVGIQPDPIVTHDTAWLEGKPVIRTDTLRPPVVQLQLSLIRAKDGARRVLLSARGGEVLDSLTVDVPLGPAAAPPRSLAWSAGVTRDLLTGAWGGVVSRDVAFARLFATGEPAQGPARAQLKIGVGLRF